MVLHDSGERREFSTGAVRDASYGKGRCDLLPLVEIAYMPNAGKLVQSVLTNIDLFLSTGNTHFIYKAIDAFILERYNGCHPTAILDVAKQFEDGAIKYGDYNWQKGIDAHCYIDSGVRHFLKWCRGDDDEPHDRAFLWNMFCLLWTISNRPEVNDLPYNTKVSG